MQLSDIDPGSDRDTLRVREVGQFGHLGAFAELSKLTANPFKIRPGPEILYPSVCFENNFHRCVRGLSGSQDSFEFFEKKIA